MKNLVIAACASLAVLAAPAFAQPEAYPSKPVKVIVPVPPGGAADVMARMIAEHPQTRLGQPFVVENRPGAGSAIGLQALAKSPPDGYTIGLGNIAANAINPAVQPDNVLKMYDPVKDFAPISLVGVTALVVWVTGEKVGG
jgi:tripartite-type tricarboxylate transporter receptor subunit TctC